MSAKRAGNNPGRISPRRLSLRRAIQSRHNNPEPKTYAGVAAERGAWMR